MNAPALPIPLRPDPGALADRDKRSTLRAITAIAVAGVRDRDPAPLLKSAWPDDRYAAEVLRAVSNPLLTTGYPVANVVGLFRSIAPKSAALELFSHGAQIDLTGLNTVAIPYVGALPASPFVAEGAPGPVLTVADRRSDRRADQKDPDHGLGQPRARSGNAARRG